MVKTSYALPTLLAICLVSSMVLAKGRQLLFSDEFNGREIDSSDWVVEKHLANGVTAQKGELQSYSPEAVAQTEGVLHLTLRKAENVDAHVQAHWPYLSGRLVSQRSYLYGRFEFRAKLPKGKGLWPLICLKTLPNAPLNGEIDIMEGFGSHPNLIQSTLHPWINGIEARAYSAWLVVRPQPDSPKFHRDGVERVEHLITLPRDLSEDFHVYGVDWQPEQVTWTFDGLPYFTVKGHVPKDPMEIVIQLAVNPDWDGKPDASTVLPQSLNLDYVRVWAEHLPLTN